MMESNKLTTIGRPFDTKYLTNRIIGIIVFVTFISVTIVSAIRGNTEHESVLSGMRAGLLIFFLWAISREVDPDNDWSAFVTIIPALLLVTFLEKPSIVTFLWLLLILRVLNHSTGMPAGIMDSLGISVIGIIMAYSMSWTYGLITAATFIADSKMKRPAKYHLPAGIVILIISTAIYVLNEMGKTITLHTSTGMYSFLAGIILFLPLIVFPERISSVGDRTGKILDTTRIKAARIMATFVFTAIVLSPGEMNTSINYFMFCIFAGTGTYRISITFLSKLSKKRRFQK